MAVPDPGSMIPQKRGMTIYARDGAGRAGDQAIATEQFEMDIYRLNALEPLIQPKTILDVGGHIGCFGLNAKSHWPTARLIAYEPERESAKLYRKNLIKNGLQGSVFTAAISYEPDKTMLSDDPAWAGGGIMVSEETQKALPDHYRVSEPQVTVVDLEHALDASGLDSIDLLKLDCEGAEMGMLRHMNGETARKIGFIVGEYHCQTGDYVFHGGDKPQDRIKGYAGFAELVQWRFPWFEVMPLGPPSDNIGNFAAGPPAIIAKLKVRASTDSVLPIRTPLGNQILLSFFDGASASIEGPVQADYQVRFNNLDTGENVYTTVIRSGQWAAANPKYFVRWEITVDENGRRVLDFTLDLAGKSVWIGLTSKSLGDTLCWMPYAEEFRKTHQCEVIVETFHRSLLAPAYPDIEFCDANTFAGNVYAGYKIGCFDNDYNRNPINWRVVPLQQVASDALGLRFHEIKPKVKRNDAPRPIVEPYVCISEFSTLQCKHWNHPDGWQKLADHLTACGLKVVSVGETWPRAGKDPAKTQIRGAISRNGLSVEETLPIIQNAEFFVGVGAGYSWVAWALDVPVVLISGFSDPWVEMKDCIRVHNASVCHGCYNDPSIEFDRNNWNWCPRKKNFECSREITPEMVIAAIKPLLHGKAQEAAPVIVPKRVLMLCPHLSTGGLPQYALWRIKKYQADGAQVEVAEWRCLSPEYVVQRKQIAALCPLHALNTNETLLWPLLDRADIVHVQEFVERWMPDSVAKRLYSHRQPDNYAIVETCHDSSFSLGEKRWIPNRIEAVSPSQQRILARLGVPVDLMEYAPEPRPRTQRNTNLLSLGLNPRKQHVLNVGLFTPGKNQSEVWEIARRLPDIEFHFVGNQAPNFAHYWKPLMADRPSNCIVWGERADVDLFYNAMDALLFASTSELAPLVPIEALAWGMPVVMRDLPIYEGSFVRDGVTFYDGVDSAVTVIRSLTDLKEAAHG